jgi:hypothetical protein
VLGTAVAVVAPRPQQHLFDAFGQSHVGWRAHRLRAVVGGDGGDAHGGLLAHQHGLNGCFFRCEKGRRTGHAPCTLATRRGVLTALLLAPVL